MADAYKKRKIPKALREAVWVKHAGPVFQHKCLTPWCQNVITAFDYQTGHNVPESKGGSTTIDNLIPICARCNLSMSNTYTFIEWSKLNGEPKRVGWLQRLRLRLFTWLSPKVGPGALAAPSK
jgi:hypothetical protein